jgi:hypothetical protein
VHGSVKLVDNSSHLLRPEPTLSLDEWLSKRIRYHTICTYHEVPMERAEGEM